MSALDDDAAILARIPALITLGKKDLQWHSAASLSAHDNLVAAVVGEVEPELQVYLARLYLRQLEVDRCRRQPELPGCGLLLAQLAGGAGDNHDDVSEMLLESVQHARQHRFRYDDPAAAAVLVPLIYYNFHIVVPWQVDAQYPTVSWVGRAVERHSGQKKGFWDRVVEAVRQDFCDRYIDWDLIRFLTRMSAAGQREAFDNPEHIPGHWLAFLLDPFLDPTDAATAAVVADARANEHNPMYSFHDGFYMNTSELRKKLSLHDIVALEQGLEGAAREWHTTDHAKAAAAAAAEAAKQVPKGGSSGRSTAVSKPASSRSSVSTASTSASRLASKPAGPSSSVVSGAASGSMLSTGSSWQTSITAGSVRGSWPGEPSAARLAASAAKFPELATPLPGRGSLIRFFPVLPRSELPAVLEITSKTLQDRSHTAYSDMVWGLSRLLDLYDHGWLVETQFRTDEFQSMIQSVTILEIGAARAGNEHIRFLATTLLDALAKSGHDRDPVVMQIALE